MEETIDTPGLHTVSSGDCRIPSDCWINIGKSGGLNIDKCCNNWKNDAGHCRVCNGCGCQFLGRRGTSICYCTGGRGNNYIRSCSSSLWNSGSVGWIRSPALGGDKGVQATPPGPTTYVTALFCPLTLVIEVVVKSEPYCGILVGMNVGVTILPLLVLLITVAPGGRGTKLPTAKVLVTSLSISRGSAGLLVVRSAGILPSILSSSSTALLRSSKESSVMKTSSR